MNKKTSVKDPDLYPDLEGRAGVFHMENYTEDSKFISFEQDE